jgi:hypothetical protein
MTVSLCYETCELEVCMHDSRGVLHAGVLEQSCMRGRQCKGRVVALPERFRRPHAFK